MLRTYRKVVSYLLQPITADDVITETDATLECHCQPPEILLALSSVALVAELLRCEEVYDEYVLKGSFFEGLHESVHHSVQTY